MKKRNQVVDIAKGIGIICIIALHVGYNSVALTCLPLFFFISGMFAPNSSKCCFSDALYNKTARLLVPCFVYLTFFCTVAFVLTFLNFPGIQYEHFFSYLSLDLLIIRNFIYQPYHPDVLPFAFTLWFLNALWFSFLLWFLFRRFIENKLLDRGGVLSVFLFLILLFYSALSGPSLNENVLVGCLSRAVWGFVFLVLGYILSSSAEKYNPYLLKIMAAILMVLCFCFEFLYWENIPIDDPKSMTYEGSIYKYLPMEISKIATIFCISFIMSKVPPLACCFSYIGRNSLQVMIYHPLGLFLMTSVNNMYNIGMDNRMFFLVLALAFSLICSGVEKTVKRYYESFCSNT